MAGKKITQPESPGRCSTTDQGLEIALSGGNILSSMIDHDTARRLTNAGDAQTGTPTLSPPGCPSWCVLEPDHQAELGEDRGHQGPSFGEATNAAFAFSRGAIDIRSWGSEPIGDVNAMDSLRAPDLRALANAAIQAAELLEAYQGPEALIAHHAEGSAAALAASFNRD
jgi:hypothetical protein